MIHKITVNKNTQASKILFFSEIDLDTLPNQRIVPLFGANGSGKTTLLKAIEEAPKILNRINYLKKKRDGEPTDSSQETIADVIHAVDSDKTKGFEYEFWTKEIEKEERKLQLEFERDPGKEVILKYRNSDDNFRTRQARSMSEDFDPAFISARWNANALSEGQSIMYSSLMLFDALKPGCHDLLEEGNCGIVLVDEIDSGLSLDNLDAVLKKIRNIVTKRDDVQIFLSFNTSYVLKYFPDVISMYDGKVHHLENEEDMLSELKANKKMLDKARKTSRGQYRIFG